MLLLASEQEPQKPKRLDRSVVQSDQLLRAAMCGAEAHGHILQPDGRGVDVAHGEGERVVRCDFRRRSGEQDGHKFLDLRDQKHKKYVTL